uniref:Transmembrane protein n=1 Tax=Chromera velia CCMP2878 TaxID=1169474 RepID=A0A0G4IAJ4_9ALVE|eukprot:Cvel_12582.t1-p1 / transcript=Cvel_12582.t1 / gene=Cvel_12582 / organism=Chromera_velia_CCMP2878 / gene_product=hypothetical protein / transcript_product=hypothetical protein / location=Cvel_scaffold828:63311-63610(-) / protein_length=100 / sequence_SO=supercontig / SO=protein_coding / is_pseudo=false
MEMNLMNSIHVGDQSDNVKAGDSDDRGVAGRKMEIKKWTKPMSKATMPMETERDIGFQRSKDNDDRSNVDVGIVIFAMGIGIVILTVDVGILILAQDVAM